MVCSLLSRDNLFQSRYCNTVSGGFFFLAALASYKHELTTHCGTQATVALPTSGPAGPHPTRHGPTRSSQHLIARFSLCVVIISFTVLPLTGVRGTMTRSSRERLLLAPPP